MRTRKMKANGLKIYQIITKNFVFGISQNKSTMNGKIGISFQVDFRKNTGLSNNN